MQSVIFLQLSSGCAIVIISQYMTIIINVIDSLHVCVMAGVAVVWCCEKRTQNADTCWSVSERLLIVMAKYKNRK